MKLRAQDCHIIQILRAAAQEKQDPVQEEAVPKNYPAPKKYHLLYVGPLGLLEDRIWRQ